MLDLSYNRLMFVSIPDSPTLKGKRAIGPGGVVEDKHKFSYFHKKGMVHSIMSRFGPNI